MIMVVPSAFKSITSASNVFFCFLVWYYSGFVNDIFYKAFVVQGTWVFRTAIKSWGVIGFAFFFFIENVFKVFIMILYCNFDVIHTAVWNLATLFVYNFVEYFVISKIFID